MPDWTELEREYQAYMRRPPETGDDWYRIEAKSDKAGKKTAELWIYDRIGASFWDEGTGAKAFAKKLAALDAEEITLHLNTPGGDAWDGMAIFNSLKDHKASVTVVVDGVALSAGSYIAQAGDRIRMNRGSQMMIHDASGIAFGPPEIMAKALEALDKMSDSIASIYAGRAGGTVAEWRAAMGKESWYTAAEAVEAGLADETVDVETTEPKTRAAFDLRIFNYAGRQAAPAPVLTGKSRPPAPPGPSRTGGAPVDITDEQLAGLRKKAGVADDADLATTLAALPDPPAAPPAAPPGPNAPPPEPQPTPQTSASGVMMVDPSAWDAQQERIRRLEASQARSARDERDKVIAEAIKDGKFSKAREEHWRTLWDKDPEGTSADIARLAKNMVPVAELGHAGTGDDDEAQWAEFDAQWPPHMRSGGAGRA